jgi:vacuolar-type H+-ATPase subunit H
MEILELIEALEDKVERSWLLPFIGKSLVDKEEILDLLQEIRIKFPEEMKQAKWVKEERQRIISDAQKEAQNIIKNAEEKIVAMVDEHEITKQAYDHANDIIQKAQENAHELRNGAVGYTENLLVSVEQEFISMVETLRENRQQLKKQ